MADQVRGKEVVMRIRLEPWIAVSVLCFFLCVTSLNVFASTCDMLLLSVDDARTKLRRANNETSFEDAKSYANRAKRSLEDAAMSAMDCRCDMAFIEFDNAATYAKRARDAYSTQEFVDSLKRSIRAFNSAVDALQMCAGELSGKLSTEGRNRAPEWEPKSSQQPQSQPPSVVITQPEMMGPKRQLTDEERAFIQKQMAIRKDESNLTVDQQRVIPKSEYNERGIELIKKGEYDKAINNFTIAISQNSRFYSAYLNRGRAFYEIKRYDDAIQDFKQATSLAPNIAEPYQWCGVALYGKEFYFEAARYFSKAIELNPNSAVYYLNRGHSYMKMGNRSSAASDFKKACDLGDNDACKWLRSLR